MGTLIKYRSKRRGDDELDQFIQGSSSKSKLHFRSVRVGNLGKRLANAVTNTASSAMSHTASAVNSIVGHTIGNRSDSSTEMKETSTPDPLKE